MLAVYTCFYGTSSNWANCIPPLPEGLDGYYFTNNPETYARVAETRWKVLWVDLPQSEDPVVCAAQTKHLRCCPHAYPILRPYAYLCWMDSKLKISSLDQLREMVAQLEASSAVWMFTHHPIAYADVWGEFREAMQHEKYARQREQAAAYIQSRLDAGYGLTPPNRVCSGFSVRKQGPLAAEIGEVWYADIQVCGIECQVSFQFVHQRYEDAILVVPYQTGWSYL